MITSEHKREIAFKLLEGHPGWYPDHNGRDRGLNDSRLCRFRNETEDVLILVKCLKRGMTKPCIGFYFTSQTKSNHLDDLRKLGLPAGFKLNEDAISSNPTGWVEFCRADDCDEDRMYSEIVAPAERREEWKNLFETLRKWATDNIGGESHYGQERGRNPEWVNAPMSQDANVVISRETTRPQNVSSALTKVRSLDAVDMSSKQLKTFQDWCIDTLYMILKAKKNYRGSLDDQGYKYTLKAIVDHYASMYYCGRGMVSRRNRKKEHINLWWDHLNNNTRRQFFSQLLMSTTAASYCLNHNCNIDEFGGQGGKLHLEHITPKGYVYNKLQRLEELTREAIAGCFKHCKLVLLTKNESDKYLDGSNAAFAEEDVKMLRDVFHVGNDCLEESEQLIGKSPKSDGSALLRMVRLYNSGVRFCDSQSRPMGPEEWVSYLNDDNYELN